MLCKKKLVWKTKNMCVRITTTFLTSIEVCVHTRSKMWYVDGAVCIYRKTD